MRDSDICCARKRNFKCVWAIFMTRSGNPHEPMFTLARLRAPCVDSAHGTQGIALQWLQNPPSDRGANR
eukprot:12088165-Alexandrium_andersonii.AAC.1